MEEFSYKPLIEGMTWSFSRLKSFEDCPYRWYLTYIREKRDEDCFYASYGSFMHSLLADFYEGRKTRDDMLVSFLTDFRTRVKGPRPQPETVKKYIESGADYIRSFRPLEMEILAVEKELRFEVDGIPFVGFADLVGRTENGIVLVDHKSHIIRPLNPFSMRYTLQDKVRDEMLRQLYLYSEGIAEEYGETPQILAFNCFRSGEIIEEPFSDGKFDAAKRWAAETVRSIEEASGFEPKPNYFGCRWICGVSSHCPYSDADAEGE